ncbi:MAG: class I SAM-dependent methyltransferase [Bacteroidota bacterium]|nr:class I SAM-dependent methyltransferase [Bacteroidota bacterium]MDP4232871.1 class I SAM-dependent methyltransferase [Bacteroidota bacterium]MDP4241915.1 class I SAM-dependent methyltransferase [Bacteroidota bacterium]MDP4288241.1 class I SAM-dependent methyltransferase [Bacteroidota bacterium]
MQIAEYDALERVEREHWFYKGKRLLVRWWIERAAHLDAGDRILDAGAGTGELVRELGGMYEHKGISVIGIEYSAEGRRLARERKGTDLLEGSILDLPLRDESCAVTIALDVLEHVEEDARAFAEMLRITKPGGLLIINVPAFMSLWSDWDVSLGHFRRYTKRKFRDRVQAQLRPAPYEVVYLDYINVFAFPAIWLYRKVARLVRLTSRAEDKIPSPRVNALMMKLFVEPSKALWFHPPFGVSLFIVLRKK